jgi:hypothetical protein
MEVIKLKVPEILKTLEEMHPLMMDEDCIYEEKASL